MLPASNSIAPTHTMPTGDLPRRSSSISPPEKAFERRRSSGSPNRRSSDAGRRSSGSPPGRASLSGPGEQRRCSTDSRRSSLGQRRFSHHLPVVLPWDAYKHDTFEGTNYRLRGPPAGPRVVCVHGIGAFHYYVEPVADCLLTEGYRVLTYDLIGRGHSKPSDSYGAEAHVEQLWHLLRHVGWADGPVYVVGHSMGGAVAAGFAVQHRACVAGLVLLSPAGLMSLAQVRLLRRLPGMLQGPVKGVLRKQQIKVADHVPVNAPV